MNRFAVPLVKFQNWYCTIFLGQVFKWAHNHGCRHPERWSKTVCCRSATTLICGGRVLEARLQAADRPRSLKTHSAVSLVAVVEMMVHCSWNSENTLSVHTPTHSHTCPEVAVWKYSEGGESHSNSPDSSCPTNPPRREFDNLTHRKARRQEGRCSRTIQTEKLRYYSHIREDLTCSRYPALYFAGAPTSPSLPR